MKNKYSQLLYTPLDMPTIYLSKAEDLATYIQQHRDKLVVVDFYADWCGPCKYIGKVFEQELLPKYGDKLVLIKVDADNEALEPLSTQFQIRGIPRLIFYYDQKIVDDVTGADKGLIESICNTYCSR